MQNHEPIDRNLINVSVKNDNSIKLLLPMFRTAEQVERASKAAISLWKIDLLLLIHKEATKHNIVIAFEQLIRQNLIN